jgi:hypothetical protein
MNIRSFAEVLADRQGGIQTKANRVYKKELTRDEVMEIFGEVPEYSIRYGLIISVTLQRESGKYELAVKEERN